MLVGTTTVCSCCAAHPAAYAAAYALAFHALLCCVRAATSYHPVVAAIEGPALVGVAGSAAAAAVLLLPTPGRNHASFMK